MPSNHKEKVEKAKLRRENTGEKYIRMHGHKVYFNHNAVEVN